MSVVQSIVDIHQFLNDQFFSYLIVTYFLNIQLSNVLLFDIYTWPFCRQDEFKSKTRVYIPYTQLYNGPLVIVNLPIVI